MYKIYHQIDREKREQDEKENAVVTDNEIRQLEALYNVSLRRDSFSTITTHDTEIIIQKQVQAPAPKKLLPITWGGMNGELPLVISVPETPKNKIFLDDRGLTETYLPPCVRSEDEDDASHLLHTSLFVDDDEELDLIFDDNQEDEMNAQRVLGNLAPFETSVASSKNSGSYVETESVESDTELVSCKPDELVRFETERFTRFEI